MMIIDLTDAIITYDIDKHPDIENSECSHTYIIHLTKENWVIVIASEGTQASTNDLNGNLLDSDSYMYQVT